MSAATIDFRRFQVLADRSRSSVIADPWLAARPLPPFPTDALPPSMAAFVRAVARESETPQDLPAMAALGVLSALAMGGTQVDCGNYQEELALYMLIAMPSGDRKSTVMRRVTDPLKLREKELREDAKATVREELLRRDILKGRDKKYAKIAAENSDAEARNEAERELEKIRLELEQLGEPTLPRLLVDDTTPEALASQLAQHGKLAVLASESAFVDNVLGRYDKGGAANLNLVCSAYNGEAQLIDRKNQDTAEIDRPLLTIVLAIQPRVLANLVEHEMARHKGFVGRFAFVRPESLLGVRRHDGPPVSNSVVEGWAHVVRTVIDHSDVPDGTMLELSQEAASHLHGLLGRIEPRLGVGGDLREIDDWVNRHHGRAARIAGILHLAEHSADEPIDEATMLGALNIADYLLAHAIAILTGPDEQTRKALRWLAERRKETVTKRELKRGPLGNNYKADVADELIRSLVDLGAIYPQERSIGPRGGAPSDAYSVDPDLIGA